MSIGENPWQKELTRGESPAIRRRANPALGEVFAEMFTTDGAAFAYSHSDLHLTNAVKSRRTRNLEKTEIVVAQDFGTRLWTSCTRLKINEIKSQEKS